jgi:hypothetical protein
MTRVPAPASVSLCAIQTFMCVALADGDFVGRTRFSVASKRWCQRPKEALFSSYVR